MISHPIENCYVFKDWVEKQDQGRRRLSKNVLLGKASEHTNLVTVAQGNEEVFWEALDEASEALRPPDRPEGVWQLVLSKKSMNLLKAVNNLTGIRWRRAPSRKKALRSPLKRKRERKGRKSSKLTVLTLEIQRKKTPIEEDLDSMEEYEQKPRTSLTLQEDLPDKV